MYKADSRKFASNFSNWINLDLVTIPIEAREVYQWLRSVHILLRPFKGHYWIVEFKKNLNFCWKFKTTDIHWVSITSDFYLQTSFLFWKPFSVIFFIAAWTSLFIQSWAQRSLCSAKVHYSSLTKSNYLPMSTRDDNWDRENLILWNSMMTISPEK